MKLRVTSLYWGRAAALAFGVVCALGLPAAAQPKKKPLEQKADKSTKTETPKEPKVQNFNLNALSLGGQNRSPQLLYFLERANEELERASLEKRSFIPHIVKTVEDEAL